MPGKIHRGARSRIAVLNVRMHGVLARRQWLFLATCLGAGLLWPPLAACAEGGAGQTAQGEAGQTAEKSVQEARNALGSRRRFPWYDETNDETRRVRVSVPWRAPDMKPKTGGTRWNFSWLELFIWTAVLALFAALAYLLIRAYLNREGRAAGAADGSTERLALDDGARIEALPFRVRSGPLGLLDEARRHYEQGDFRQAIVYLFSYELVEMDKQQVIRLAKGKTNRQYLRETRPRPLLRSLVEQTMVAFEDVFFGDHSLDRSRFESCWRRLDEFQSLIAPEGR